MHTRDLVLVGGGHAHALVIRRLAMKPLPGVRVTLVSDQAMTAYSGMLPGLIAGHYDHEETHIDLNRLCRKAGVRFIENHASGLDAENRRLHLQSQPDLAYDVLSIDTGSTPNTQQIPGAEAHGIGVKPVSRFHAHWQQAIARLAQTRQLRNWGVIGAGAGGVELVLAMAHALRDRADRVRLHLIFRAAEPLDGYPAALRKRTLKALRKAGVELHSGFDAIEITADSVHSRDGRSVNLAETFLCTPAAAPEWPAKSGLATANGGFIRVNNGLQSTSHPNIFAAGDIAEMVDAPRPKSGVYAVRQAPALYDNLRRHLEGEPLEELQLQSDFLSLLSLGPRRAVGGRNGLVVHGRWVWRWKDRIDRKFMTKLNGLARPDMSAMPRRSGKDRSEESMAMHCAGCGSKLGPDIIGNALSAPGGLANGQLQPALGQAEDAALFTPTPDHLQVQSVDGFRAFTRDLYTFGQVSVLHALSDLYAMNAEPRYVQLLVNLEFAHPRLQRRDFERLMAGIRDALDTEQAALAGGHSTEGAETHLGLSVSGEVAPGNVWRKGGAQPGDWLVLTKPLGTGVILAADAEAAAPSAAVKAARQAMLTSNLRARDSLRALSPHAVTDVTGFGLLGHLLEILDAGGCDAELWPDRIPALDGALALLEEGWTSSLYPQLRSMRSRCDAVGPMSEARLRLLLDPQTSGGLLACLSAGTPQQDLPGTVIGRITAIDGSFPSVRLNPSPARTGTTEPA